MKRKMNLLQLLGLLLVVIGFGTLLGSILLGAHHEKQLKSLTARLEASLPSRSEGDPENYSDPALPELQLDGEHYVGLLELRSFGVKLPVGSTWDAKTASRYPCRFLGSPYDSSLIIGGSNRKGQLDFCSRLDMGDFITFIDMTGTVFTYEVVRINRRDHADLQTLRENDWDLTLFTRDSSSLDYILVGCELAP